MGTTHGTLWQFGWLSEQQFLDAVAVAMITPGPVVITVAFIGFLAAAFLGATAAFFEGHNAGVGVAGRERSLLHLRVTPASL